MMLEREADIVIIGAGLAGLRLADRLRRENQSKSILVIEANNRIGGRMISQSVQLDPDNSSGSNALEVVVDGGAQFVGGTHKKALELLEELGLEKFAAAPDASGKFRWCQEIGPWLRFGLSPDPAEPPSFEALREETESLAATIPIDAPWNAPNADELDSQTFGEWLKTKEKKYTKSACVPYERLCKMHLGCDPDEISLLYMLFLLHSTGGYYRFVKHEEGGAHQWRVRGGSWQMCQRLAERIGPDLILLGLPVKEILHHQQEDPGRDEKQGSCVEIRGDTFRIKAKERVVVTLQPQLCKKIRFEPPLNTHRLALCQNYLTKRPFTAKTHFVYDHPFWRTRGFSGTGVTSSGIVFVDNSPPPNNENNGEAGVGILLAFRDMRRSDLMHNKLLQYAKTLFGKQAAHPKQIIEQDWSTEEWTASCISYTPPGIITQHGQALREPIAAGRIHWAGAETSPVWPSFMEGALHSADRVFEEINDAGAQK